jgi:nucleoside-triphosphatase THEP1
MKRDLRVIASISYRPHPVCDRIKRLPQIELITMDRANRNGLVEIIIKRLIA